MESYYSLLKQNGENCNQVNVNREGFYGQTKKGMRHGIGVYSYMNSFFKYEGDWFQGVKQGCGTFVMRDGSYYKGCFLNGEIHGRGERYWAHSKNLFVGLFDFGEINGEGVMKYGNGDMYEGTWLENKKEGNGKLRHADGSVYSGAFHFNKPHGEGRLMFNNGEEFIGEWVNGMRHGHGIYQYQDGSLYEGQWRCNQFHGEGIMTHSSGIYYNGLWINGRPLQCGRLLKVSAGVLAVNKLDIPAPKESTRILAKIGNENIELETYPLVTEVIRSTSPIKTCLVDNFIPVNEKETIPTAIAETVENKPPQLQATNNGKVTFNKLLLPPLSVAVAASSSISLSPDKVEAQPTNRNRKASVPPSYKVDLHEKKRNDTKKKEALNELKKEEVLNKKFCKPGDYIIIVEDVTENPFLDIRLETIYFRIKVLPTNVLEKSQ
ncbi:MORN repeat-containing protein 1 isoform X3 [Hydra vulgaris]|uniref:MORN repeat-containing protein 1 isoform X3 n=1 Tax=Hydra vulgaris TaxID=6087 RepID=A0ABM4D9I1_HYDVU